MRHADEAGADQADAQFLHRMPPSRMALFYCGRSKERKEKIRPGMDTPAASAL
jgi:hypothetical protein